MRIFSWLPTHAFVAAPATFAVLLGFTVPAWADEDGDSPANASRSGSKMDYQNLVDEGMSLYKAHEYRQAIEKFLQAYAIERDSNLLFNVARCYEAQGQKAAAIEKYEEYLADPDIDTTGRARAEKAIRALRKAEKVHAPLGAHPDDDTARSEQHPTSVDGTSTRIVVGWVATAVLAAGAAVTGIVAIDSATKLDNAKKSFPGDKTEIDNLSKRTLVLSVTADTLGVAAAIIGGVSLYWTVTSSTSPSDVKVGIGPGGLRMAGAF